MATYGLLGYPLGHSFSRRYFLSKFKAEDIKASFENFELKTVKEMLDVVHEREDLMGFAITIPHKESILPFLDECDKAIDHIGAVNCVKINREGDKLTMKGYNTDVIGFEKSFLEYYQTHHKKALILGTGGASKAVAYVMHKLGIQYEVVSRRKTLTTLCYEDITAAKMKDIQVVVNTTPLGMHPKVDVCPDLPYEAINSSHYFYDLVYNPLETLFLTKAKEQGADVKAGMDMLELQAEENWLIWSTNYDAAQWSLEYKN